MSEQFKDQGGMATMDPSRLMRWLTSRVMSRVSRTAHVEARHARAEQARVKAGAPHRVDYAECIRGGQSPIEVDILDQGVGRNGRAIDEHGGIIAWRDIHRHAHRRGA